MTRWTQQRAVAEHLMMNLPDLKEYEYQAGRHGSRKVYAIGSSYYVAVPEGSAVSLPDGYAWEKIEDAYVARNGWSVFVAKAS